MMRGRMISAPFWLAAFGMKSWASSRRIASAFSMCWRSWRKVDAAAVVVGLMVVEHALGNINGQAASGAISPIGAGRQALVRFAKDGEGDKLLQAGGKDRSRIDDCSKESPFPAL